MRALALLSTISSENCSDSTGPRESALFPFWVGKSLPSTTPRLPVNTYTWRELVGGPEQRTVIPEVPSTRLQDAPPLEHSRPAASSASTKVSLFLGSHSKAIYRCILSVEGRSDTPFSRYKRWLSTDPIKREKVPWRFRRAFTSRPPCRYPACAHKPKLEGMCPSLNTPLEC